MQAFPVSESKLKDLLSRMEKHGIKESEFEESFVRSSGPGGQNVNKVSTCVVLRHVPTGLTIKCMETRSQALNRFIARRLLVDEISARTTGEATAREQERWKIRTQKRRRSRRAKEKMLQEKHLRSRKKQSRREADRPSDM